MLVRSAFLSCLVIALSATPAFCDDLGATRPADGASAPAPKPHSVAKKPKVSAKDATTGALDQIQFSQPNAPPVGVRKAAAPPPLAKSGAAQSEPQGGVSFDVQWHATNDKTDPYDAVRHSSGPN